jgi:DNA-3-methyladenine glycosylase II
MTARFTLTHTLPADYRLDTLLAFHRRDAQHVSERVGTAELAKGLVWRGAPACLSMRFTPGQAEATLELDAGDDREDAAAFAAMTRRMLGLGQDVEAFEARFRDHHELGVLIAAHGGLRVPQAATPFEALSWAITGQQISVHAAVAMRRKLIQAVGMRHSGGLYCYPQAGQVAALDDAALRGAGFSSAKAATLLAIARAAASGALPLDAWAEALPDVAEVRAALLAVKGIGPWTVNYALLRGFGWLDGSLHGDVAVRRGVARLRGDADKPGEAAVRDWLAPFSPWRALVCAHLWAYQSDQAY